MNLFKKKYVTIKIRQDDDDVGPAIPDGMWLQCRCCCRTIYRKELTDYMVCPDCGSCFRISAKQRIALIADEDSFEEFDGNMAAANTLQFPDYEKKLETLKKKLSTNEAVITGTCMIGGIRTLLCVMDSGFIMGSMGAVVGEKITRAFEYAERNELPVIVFTASGGARMQEGILSLMQMAKVSAAVKRHSDKGLLYVSVLTDPTTGGVTASFAMLGDIILSEPKALIGFAGRRVIEETLKRQLPEDFQTAEFLLEHGFIDKIVRRDEMKDTLCRILKLHKDSGRAFEEIPKPPKQGEISDTDAMEVVKTARNVLRPTVNRFIDYLLQDYIELHGDRRYKDDKAVVGGIGYLDGKPVTVIGTQKGSNLEENIFRNFGQPNPEGYRKALRLMKQAEKFNRPVVTMINTAGAFCGAGAEKRGQGEAIAQNLYQMSALKVPVIAVIIGEGGSGGALALAVSDKVFMFEYAMYSILSPEGFASILWKDGSRASEAATFMKLTAKDLLGLKVIENIIPEAAGGCQNNFEYSANYLKQLLILEIDELCKNKDTLLDNRYERFRKFGDFVE